MGIHGQPREGGVTGRVLAWHPRSWGAAEGGARGHLLPSVTLLLPLPAGGHGAHRKAMGGAPDPPEVAQGRTPPSLPPPGAQTCAMPGAICPDLVARLQTPRSWTLRLFSPKNAPAPPHEVVTLRSGDPRRKQGCVEPVLRTVPGGEGEKISERRR